MPDESWHDAKLPDTGAIRKLNDLQAAVAEHMTDEQLALSRLAGQLMADQMLYGFHAIDEYGQRVDPRTLQPWRSDA